MHAGNGDVGIARRKTFVLLWGTLVLALGGSPYVAAQMPLEQAWLQLPQYEYGQDMAALLLVDRAVIDSMATPASRAQCAARLAQLVDASSTTLAARQYICFQLRQVGTEAEVPVLARLLLPDDTSAMARNALESIPGEAARQALLSATKQLGGQQLVGLINSLGKRQESASVDELARLAKSDDTAVQAAAWRALANIGDDRALDVLWTQAEQAPDPLTAELAAPLLQSMRSQAAAGKREVVQALYTRLSQDGQRPALRRAGLEGLLSLQQDGSAKSVTDWLLHGDAVQRRVAMGHLDALSSEQLASLSADLATLPTYCVVAVVDVMAKRDRTAVLPKVLQLADSDNPQLRLAGIRLLGAVGDNQAVPRLIAALGSDDAVSEAARQSLEQLSREVVGPALLAALDDPSLRRGAIDVLKRWRYYDAIDSLVVLAMDRNPDTYTLAMDGLRGIADPDSSDLPRLLKVLLQAQSGAQRDEAEKTLVIVCGKEPDAAARMRGVKGAMEGFSAADRLACLPLLGRLGDPESLPVIESFLASGSEDEKDAAVRALCNWPDASVADRLVTIAAKSTDQRFRRRALRAYVRVVSLPSQRPESETLAMLQTAMQQADVLEDQRLIVERAGSVRSLESVMWIATFLDKPDLAQQACQSLVELAHHRELRHPNMQQFGPLLDRVAAISRDPQVVQRARRYRLGL